MKMETNNKNSYKKIAGDVFYYFDIVARAIKALFLIFLAVALIGGALILGTMVGFFASLTYDMEAPDNQVLAEEITNYEVTSTMYYAGGEVISDLNADLIRTPTSLESVSPYVEQGLIATEDEYFYEHNGVVPKAIIRALIQQVAGTADSSGGSTLTQQLVKQQVLTNEVSFERKAKEILLAMHVEDLFDKDQILEAYLNVSPFGRNNSGENIAGIQEAATGIFGVEPSELNLPQAAFLAGLPQSPIVYSPYTQYGTLKEDVSPGIDRQQTVLFNMVREGFITLEEYEEAIAYDIASDFISQEESDQDINRSFAYDIIERQARSVLINHLIQQSPHSKDEVNQNNNLAQEFYEEADRSLRNDGYEIYSTLHHDLHTSLQAALNENLDYLGQAKTITMTDEYGNAEQVTYPVEVGSSLIDNQTGAILAFIGGRNYETSNYNIPFDTRRSPGSSMKPLVVYGPAIAENLITPYTIVPDTEYEVPSYENGQLVGHPISNYGGITGEWNTATEWLARSQNIPASKIYMEMMDNNITPAPYLRRMGIGTDAIADEEFANPSAALGGFAGGATVNEITGAFAGIANGGYFNEPFIVQKILDQEGQVIYEHQAEATQIWEEDTNYLVREMMKSVTESDLGTASQVPEYLNFDTELISKTGTSQDYRDLWYIASTPEISFGTWAGYDNQNLSMTHDYGIHPSVRLRTFWARMMNAMHAQAPETIAGTTEFSGVPDTIEEEEILTATGMQEGEVSLPSGETVTISGDLETGHFKESNVPGGTTYDFALGATEEELNNFWANQSQNDDLWAVVENFSSIIESSEEETAQGDPSQEDQGPPESNGDLNVEEEESDRPLLDSIGEIFDGLLNNDE